MLPIIQQEVVNHHHWISEEDFVDMVAVTQSAPGPVAVNTSIFIGYKIAGISGAISSLIGVILPAFTIILLLATLLSSYKDNYYVNRFFAGVRPAIVGLIIGVGIKTGRKIMHSLFDFFLAGLALTLLLLTEIHPLWLILFGAFSGLFYSRWQKNRNREVS